MADEMFEISKNQLRQLTDVDLRELVARLCQAELRLAGAPVSAVRWAGAHTAADGGLDVDCRVEIDGFHGDFVPRARTGFQVKKSTMPPSRIGSEMSPEGQLRPIFEELAACNGCYVIVSLDDDPTGDPATQRHGAMRRQLDALHTTGDVRTDFYGCSELANWLAQHPGVQLWVRDTLGITLDGWRPHGRWTITPPNDSDELICELGLEVVLPGRHTVPHDIESGIDQVRDLVRTSDKAVRIVGLSGVGKSRFVQALFEESVGNDPLDRNQAIYADLGAEPTPSPRTVLARLAADNRRAILVLDNCPIETHHLIASEASATPDIRLITIEYDIREDRPEVTAVVRINAEGTDIVQALVARRFPQLGLLNFHRIAEFSGGNARLGLSLADAVGDEENLSDFSDAQLFDRLFYQRGARDTALLAAAQVLALVYSYSICEDEGGVDELAVLASLLGESRRTLYRATQTLLDRQLVQQRGHWRAVLPQAVSNRLAAGALDNVPHGDIRDTFENHAGARLLKSFGKRLSYLHDHECAREIVQSWLSPGGLLHIVEELDGDQIQLLTNVAPVTPAAVLHTFETRASQPDSDRFFGDANSNARSIAVLLCSIAYDATLFERCIILLVQFAIARGQPQSDVPSRLFALFALHLSGTEASPDLRERIIRRYLCSARRDERKIGLGMLDSALTSGHGGAFAVLEFGARPRTFGYWPRTQEEHDQWFLRFIALARSAATADHADLSEPARELLAANFRELWHFPALRTALDAAARAIHAHKSWPEGWRAVRSVKYYDYRSAEKADFPEEFELLDELDRYLQPARLADEVRVYVLDVGQQHFSLRDEFDDEDQADNQELEHRAGVRAYDLGIAVAGDLDTLDEVSLDLFNPGFGFRIEFGKGLASTYDDPRALWRRLVGYLAPVVDTFQKCDVLCGVLAAIHERHVAMARAILDEAAENVALRPFIVNLYLSVPNVDDGSEALRRALEFDDTSLHQFGFLALQRPPCGPTEELLRDLYVRLLERPDGAGVILSGLSVRARASRNDRIDFGPELKRVGLLASAVILRDAPYRYNGVLEHRLSGVLEFCLDESEFPEESHDVFDAFLARVISTYGTTGGLFNASAVLAEKLPVRFLDGVFLNPACPASYRRELFLERHQRTNALDHIEIAELMDWCRQGNFQERLHVLAEATYPFTCDDERDVVALTRLANAMIDVTDDPAAVLGHFANRTCPRGWSGSRADIIAQRARSFESLLGDSRPAVRRAAEEQMAWIGQLVERERRREQAEDQRRDQRFE